MRKEILISSLFLVFQFSILWSAGTRNKEAKIQDQRVAGQESQKSKTEAMAAQSYNITWSSLNGGGDITMRSTTYRLKVSTAQSVIGFSSSANYDVGIGFWYGPGLYCLAKPGDANASNTLTLADIIATVNYIFNKPGCAPTPVCWLSGLVCRGDWNGDGNVTLSDVIHGVNYIFNKPGGPWNPRPSGLCCL